MFRKVIYLVSFVLVISMFGIAEAANVYSAIILDSDYWDGTIAWGYDATSNIYTPTAHANQGARDAQYVATYTSLAAWEDARDGLAQVGDTEYAIIQGPWVNPDTTTCVIDTDWSSDSIIIKAIGVARCNGIWDDADAYTLEVASEDDARAMSVYPTTTIDGLQFHDDSVVASSNEQVRFFDTDTYILSNCFFSSFGAINSIRIATAGTLTVYNCILINPHVRGAGGEGIHAETGATFLVYNCIVYNYDDGIEDSGATSTVINCAIFECIDDLDSIDTHDYNATDQGAGEGVNGVDISGTWDSTCFVDAGGTGPDWGVQDTDSPIYNTGNGATPKGVFTTDIVGTTRGPADLDWDIGAFEYVSVTPSGQVIFIMN